jgi:hypothetical protein
VLQADFLLTANREDIDSSSPWNKVLRDHIPHALLSAIQSFNAGDLRYCWLRYLPFSTRDFFRDLPLGTLLHLSQQMILESLSGALMTPSQLVYVPEEFTDNEGKPLIITQHTMTKYLSYKYSPDDWQALESLHVTRLSAENFFNDLKEFISESPIQFQGMPHPWHSRVSRALVALLAHTRDLERDISVLQIVPLRDGSWISPRDGGHLLFPLTSNCLTVPESIGASEVHPDVVNDPHRRSLLMFLGAKDCIPETICEIILETHSSDEFRPEIVSNTALISHAVFLYHTEYSVAGKHDLWFLTEKGSYCRGSQVYIDYDVPYSASNVFAECRSHFFFLHKDYCEAFSGLEDWEIWLIENLNVSALPRLVIPSSTPKGSFIPSDDFKHLMKTSSYSTVLLILRHHWGQYSQWIVPANSNNYRYSGENAQQEKTQTMLRGIFSSMDVKCLGGITCPLGQTYLPRKSMLMESDIGTPKPRDIPPSNREIVEDGVEDSNATTLPETSRGLPFLDIPDPDHDQWDVLEHFGVTIKVDVSIFINRLWILSGSQTMIQLVSELYDKIEQFACYDNFNSIR